jgi:sec-independent protein translocase protein TatB
MFSIPHIVIIFIVVLVVFGPHKLPELARSLGKMMAEFRKASTDFKMAFEEEMRTIERQARELEWKKSQEAAAAAGNGEAQPATLATPAGSETEKILPESIEVPEPTITPVSESVARESQSVGISPATPSLDGSEPVTEATTTERISPDPSTSEDTASTGDSPTPDLPAHDQRQSA